ncbi:MAG: glycosyltransferase family 4 protein [Actinobacteria bacterium]|nr:glycosyltransferase family 4 protein [Actinomycetota bacterium]
MKKVVHISTVHPAFDTRIFHKEAKTLVANGYRVTLIARKKYTEVVEGVRVAGLPEPENRMARMLFLTRKAYQLADLEEGDIYHLHDPELLIYGLFLKLKGARVIYDVHEDVPKQIMGKDWIPRIMRKPASFLAWVVEYVTSHMIDGTVAATPTILERFPRHKTIMVQNFPLLEEFRMGKRFPYGERPKYVIYMGVISEERGIKEVIHALNLVGKDINVRLILAGRFYPHYLRNDVANILGWEHVEYIGWQDRENLADRLGNVRAGILTFHPLPNHVESQPTKLFEYMAAGLPVIVSDFPLWRRIIEETGCGILVNPLDPREIAEAITWIMEHQEEAEAMGKRGQEAIKDKYNWESEATKLIEFYKAMS